MERIAVFPGSFDPFTTGHESIVKRFLPLFDKIIIAIGVNSHKTSFFPLEKRKEWIRSAFQNYPQIVVDDFTGEKYTRND